MNVSAWLIPNDKLWHKQINYERYNHSALTTMMCDNRTIQYRNGVFMCSSSATAKVARLWRPHALAPFLIDHALWHYSISDSVHSTPLLLLISHRTANFGFTDGRRRGRLQFTDLTDTLRRSVFVVCVTKEWAISAYIGHRRSSWRNQAKRTTMWGSSWKTKSKFSDTLNLAFGEN